MLKKISDEFELAQFFDHTLLKPDASKEQIRELCEQAKKYRFKSVCVNSSRIGLATKFLTGSDVLPIVVVGFPLGACTTEAKVFEAKQAVELGAREVDMVLNIGALKDGDISFVDTDIKAVVQAVEPIPVKVILETALLTEQEKRTACLLAKGAGAAFVKTSTGFSTGGATVADVKLMRETVGETMGVKASGGIRTLETAMQMLEAGANRLGASASVKIIEEFKTEHS